MASKIGAICHIFRDIDVFKCFSAGGPFGRNHGKSTENVNISKYMTGDSLIGPWRHGHEGGAGRGGRRVYSPD